MPTYQTRNPLARTSPLRSIPLLRVAPVRMSDMDLALWELDRARVAIDSLQRSFDHSRECLGRANRAPRVCRRRFQSVAMSGLNTARARLRAGLKRVAAAQAAIAALRMQPTLALAA